MELTDAVRAEIDVMTLEAMIRRWRFSPAGDPMMQGESAAYLQGRMDRLKAEDPEAFTEASKAVGWGSVGT